MQLCNQCPTNINCQTCLEFFEGGTLKKKVFPPLPVSLRDEGGNSYSGKLIGISPVGMLIETNAPVQNYLVEIKNKIKARVTPIHKKEIQNLIPFDIVEILRKGTRDSRLSKKEYDAISTDKKQLVHELTEKLNADIRQQIRDELYIELAKSELLDRMTVGNSYIYDRGKIRLLSGNSFSFIQEKDLLPLMREALRNQRPARSVLIDEESRTYVDVHALPFDLYRGGFITLDISDIVMKEKQLLQEQWENYKDIILSLTKGKIHLLNQAEMKTLLDSYERQSYLDIDDAKQLAPMRSMIKEEVAIHGIKAFLPTLAVNEAATNALRHAQACRIEFWHNDTSVLITITDRGTGIQMKDLPKAALVDGFSTQQSLGKGFHVMTQSSDKLYVKSDSTGTTIGLLFNKSDTP